MARLGRIKRIRSRLYRDLDTGRFIKWETARPIVETARFYSYLRRRPTASFAKAKRTLTALRGIAAREAEEIIADYRARWKTWVQGGREGEQPTLTS